MNIWSTIFVMAFFGLAGMANCKVPMMAQEDDSFHLILGKSLYVPKEDLLGSIPNGIDFFEKIPEECQRKLDQSITSKDQSFYRNTEDFYKSTATETNLKADYASAFTVGFTLDVTTKHVSGTKREVSGTSLNLATKSHELQFKPECVYETPLDDQVLSDFKNLPQKVNNPWYESSWREFQKFLERHGTHVITAVTYGSSIDQYAFAKSSEEYTHKDFTVKACLSLGIPAGAGKVGLSACSGVTKEDRETITNKEMTTTITVKGGKPETRGRMIYGRTDDLIVQFLQEGHTDPAPIQFELTPIFKIFEHHSQTRAHISGRLGNLQHYFDGYLNFGCPYQPGFRGPPLQKFDLSPQATETYPIYQCTLAPQGCHDNGDCSYQIGVKCRCRGHSCIRYRDRMTETGQSRTTAEPNWEGNWSWMGCDWKLWGSQCACKHPNPTRLVLY